MGEASVGWTWGALNVQHTANGIAIVVNGHQEEVPFNELNELIDYISSVSVEERRRAFRVPVLPKLREAIQARVRVAGRARQLTLSDLSLTGCRAMTPRGWVVPPEPFSLGLRMGSNRIVLTAEVVRRNSDGIALRFQDTMKDGILTPPDGLVRIQRALELEWLRGRMTE